MSSGTGKKEGGGEKENTSEYSIGEGGNPITLGVTEERREKERIYPVWPREGER